MLNKFIVGATVNLLRALCWHHYIRFHKSLNNPNTAQQAVFEKVVRDLAKSDYGKSYGITGKENYQEFATRIPVQTYEQLQPWITQQLSQRKSRSITPHRIIHVEPTSGSSNPAKQIPYTVPLIKSFTNMFRIWAYDLLSNRLAPETGRMFISVSPAPGKLKVQNNIQSLSEGVSGSGERSASNRKSESEGVSETNRKSESERGSASNRKSKSKERSASNGEFESDGDYLEEPLRSLVSRFLVTPPAADWPDFQHQLALTLLEDEQLEIISVWSPTYLLVVLDYIKRNKSLLDSSLTRRVLSCSDDSPIDWQKVWPRLKLISCWDSAMAQTSAAQVRKLFPNVHVQGKGLLATEAPITVPLMKAGGCLPLLNDVFLEFETKNGTIKRLHELVDGERCQVIVTQQSGLTRYRLHDVVEVQGFFRQTAKLEFVGRANSVCDLAGEKLQEEFVRRTLTAILPQCDFLLTPTDESHLGYVLLVDPQSTTRYNKTNRHGETGRYDESNRHHETDRYDGVTLQADAALCQAHHYRLARDQGQIAPLQMLFVANLKSRLQDFHQEEGMKIGNIKEVALLTDLTKAKRLLVFLNARIDNCKPLHVSSSEQSYPPHSISQLDPQLPVEA